MKFCSKCGAQIEDDAVICVKCGCAVAPEKKLSKDEKSTGFNVLAFFIPLIGLILWLIWKEDYPIKSKSIGKSALIGFCISIGLSIVTSIIYGSMLGSMLGGMYASIL